MGPVTRVTRDPGCDSQVISGPGAHTVQDQENARNRERAQTTNYKSQVTTQTMSAMYSKMRSKHDSKVGSLDISLAQMLAAR